ALGVNTVALLVLLAGAAVARIIWADLFTGTPHLHNRFFERSTRHAGLFEFTLLLALELLLHLVDCGLARTARAVAGTTAGCRLDRGRLSFFFRTAAADHLHEIEITNGLFLEALEHRLKHLKAFALVFN